MFHVFIGYDHRQAIAYTALDYSIRQHAKRPVAITPLVLHTLPVKRQGLTPFTYSRFLVPYLMGYQGWALFLDIDTLARCDVSDLMDWADDDNDIMVVPHEDHLKFERPSVMLFNCSRLARMTPEWVTKQERLHLLEWAKLGWLPPEYNHLVGYNPENPAAKIVHFTQGVPVHPEIGDCEYASEWRNAHRMANSTLPWKALMGNSVHAIPNEEGQPIPRLAHKRASG